MEPEDELQSLSSTSRIPRALTLIAVSILAISVAGIAYVRPVVSLDSSAPEPVGKPRSYQLASVDFVTPAIGWVVMERPAQDFALLRTADAGETWTRQLVGPAGEIGEYARFFDAAHGVLVLLGPQAAIYQTSDGGGAWSRHLLPQGGGYVWSADFVDPAHGWFLAQGPNEGAALFRTGDGGSTWTRLGDPVAYPDWAYRVVFANASDGWLYSHSAEPYAYKSIDGGVTWSRVALPAPPGGWPSVQGGLISAGDFFVAAHPTGGAGVITTVVGVASRNGRLRIGGVLLGYPPLRVSTYDGGRPITTVYADVSPYRYSSVEHLSPGPFVASAPSNQYHLSSVDGGLSWHPILTPSDYGALGYLDAFNWWWIGSGLGSTSLDAGRTWTDTRGLGVPAPLPGSLQFIDSNHAWFGALAGNRSLVEATDDGGIHWRMSVLPEIAAT